MSFYYFFNKTELDNSVISDTWLYPAATGSGNFTVGVSRPLLKTTEDFSLVFTYNKLTTGTVNLIKGKTWEFGIDSSNFAYIKSSGEAYTFDDITLGKKNCLSLDKNGNAFSVTKYNVPSAEIEDYQSVFFSPQANLTGSGILFGNNFSGTVDQLALFNTNLSEKSLETIFSGFLALPIISVSPSGDNFLDSFEWNGQEGVSSGILNFLFTGIQASFPLRFFNKFYSGGNYYGESIFVGPNFVVGNYSTPSPIQGFCPVVPTDNLGTQILSAQSGLPSSFAVPIFINYVPLTNSYFSFDFKNVKPGLSLSLSYKYGFSGEPYPGSNTGYYSGFEMQGVVSPEAHTLMLTRFDTKASNINKLGIFDIVSGLFLASGALPNDRVFLDGAPETGYSVNGAYIDIANIVETQENQLIYDSVAQNTIIPVVFNTNNFATGNFYPETSAVFTGDYSFAPIYRVLEGDYLETHSLHLYHGKNVPNGSGEAIYSNSDDFWI